MQNALLSINNNNNTSSSSPPFTPNITQLQSELQFYKNENTDLKKTHNLLKTHLNTYISDKTSYLLEKSSLLQQIKTLTSQNESLLSINATLRQSLSSLQCSLSNTSSLLSKTLSTKSQLKHNLHLFLNENKHAASHITKLEQQLTLLTDHQHEHNELIKANTNLKDEIALLQQQVLSLQMEVRECKVNEMKLRKEMKEEYDEEKGNEYEMYICGLKEEIHALEIRNGMIQEQMKNVKRSNEDDYKKDKVIWELKEVIKRKEKENEHAKKVIDVLKREVEFYKKENQRMNVEIHDTIGMGSGRMESECVDRFIWDLHQQVDKLRNVNYC